MTRFIMSISHCDSQCRHHLNFKNPLLLAFPYLLLENFDVGFITVLVWIMNALQIVHVI